LEREPRNYLVPVNADIPEIDIVLVDEEDPHVNPLGIKGIGEIGNVGSAAAVAQAVYHATEHGCANSDQPGEAAAA